MNGINPEAEQILKRIRYAQQLIDEQDYAKAAGVAKLALLEAKKTGLRSAHLHWVAAVAHDLHGELELAFEQVTQALAADPLAPPIHHSLEVIVRRIGERLAGEGRDDADPSTPRLYRLLQRSGTIPLGAHLAMVRHHASTGALDQARRLAEALAHLNPAEAQAWRALAMVARLQGDHAAAKEAEAQADIVPALEVPFGVPGVAEA